MSRDLDRAIRALEDAEQQVRDAEDKRATAEAGVDAALSEVGWRRVIGALSATATPLYASRLYPDATLSRPDVLRTLREQEAMRR